MVDMSGEELCKTIENDEFYKAFLEPNSKRNADVLDVANQVAKLTKGIDLLAKELQNQVISKHDNLLVQASHATKLESVLQMMDEHAQVLLSNVERLRSQVVGPCQLLENQTKVLSRLHIVSHILRRVNRIQQLNKKLNNTSDPMQQALLLQELEQLLSGPELNEIEAVSLELISIRSQRQKMISLAFSSLLQGINSGNSAQTKTALQIYLNLGTLNETVDKIVKSTLDDCNDCLKSVIESTGNPIGSKSKTGPGRANITSSQGVKGKIIGNLEKVFLEDIFCFCKQIIFLQTVLSEMNIPKGYDNVAAEFWKMFETSFAENFKSSPASVQEVLENEFPKCVKLFTELLLKLNYSKFVFDRSILNKWENAYLSVALSHLMEPVQSMFDTEDAPSQDQVDALIRIVTNELSLSLIDEILAGKISKNVSKCISMFGVKTEHQVAVGPDAAQVIAGAPNTGQQLNVRLANMIFYLQTQLARVLANMSESLPKSAAKIVEEASTKLDNLSNAILQPLCVSVNSAIETILVTIHLESDWNKLQYPPGKINISCSPYMRELTQFLSRVYHIYLANFKSSHVLSFNCNEIAKRCIDLFIRHSTLLRPINSSGRLRLQADYNQIENTLKILCPYLTELGKSYRLLKSMASLIVLPPEEIIKSQESSSSVPASTVLFLLFSYGGSELTSPHQNTGWSINKLSAWLDEHPTEADRLDLVAGSLQRYLTLIRQKNSTNFDPIYPIMNGYLKKVLSNK